MKTILALAALAIATPALAGDYVNGYTRKDGTYVAPHFRSSPDSNRYNNYSSQGMVNPYTGRSGTVNPYNPPSYNHGNTYTNPYRQR
jgi:hypothetical protein